MNRLFQALDFILFSSLWISLGAYLLCVEIHYLLLGTPGWSWPYAITAGLATLSLYTAHRILGNTTDRDRLLERDRLVARQPMMARIVVLLSALGALGYSLEYIRAYPALFIISGIIGLLYVVKIGPVGLRRIPYAKIFIIAVSWALVTAYLPSVLIDRSAAWPLIAERFLFILGITLPFDLRDRWIDEDDGIRTIAQHLGDQSLHIAAGILLVGASSVFWLERLDLYDLRSLIALIIVYLISILAVLRTHQRDSDRWYLGVLDGLILLHTLALLASHLQPG